MNIKNFVIDDFVIDIKEEILIITRKNGVIKDDIAYIKSIFEENTGKIYNYIMYQDSLGYYHGYDFINNTSVYCTSISKKYAIELFKQDLKQINKNK